MQNIISNPYRIIGILIGTKASEQSRRITRLKHFIEADLEPDLDFSFPCLGNLIRTDDTIVQAASKLNLDIDKITAAIFWFYNGNSITDEPAFDSLKDGNIDEAIKIWLKLISSSEISERNCSAYQNLSSLLFFMSIKNDTIDKTNFEKAIELKLKFLESDFAKEFKLLATDETFKTTKKELQLILLSELLNEINIVNNDFSHTFLDVIHKLDFLAKKDFLKSFTNKPIEDIENKIEESKKKRKENKAKADVIGNELFNSTQIELEQLKSILGDADVKFISISDKLANEISQCSTDIFNHFLDTETEVGEICLELDLKAKSIARGSVVLDRINEGLPIVNEYIKNRPKRELKFKCFFCLKNTPNSHSEIKRLIYKEKSRTQYYNKKSVLFSELSVTIPRCNSCKKMHEKAHNEFLLYTIGGTCISGFIGYLFEEHFIIGGIIGGVLGAFIGDSFKNKFLEKNCLKGESDSILRTHPIIKDYFNEGWTFTKPSA